MFADPNSIDGKYYMSLVTPKRNRPKAFSVPVLVVPLTPKARAALVNKALKVAGERWTGGDDVRRLYAGDISAILKAIGI